MLPVFPDFEKLGIQHRHAIESLVKKFAPYSDYNFTSLFSWDSSEKIEISNLGGNLAVKFDDYATDDQFFTMLGVDNVDRSLTQLIEFAHSQKMDETLKMVPETTINAIKDRSQFIIEEDRDNFDYIFSTEDIATAQGSHNSAKRNLIRRFQKEYEHRSHTKALDLNDEQVKSDILRLFERWEKSRNKDRQETTDELAFIQKLLKHTSHLDLQAMGLFIEGELAGVTIYELIQDNHGVMHFEKADVSYIGIFQYLKQKAAQELLNQGAKHINYEQDMGIPGLRQSKLMMHPTHFLKKFTVRLQPDN